MDNNVQENSERSWARENYGRHSDKHGKSYSTRRIYQGKKTNNSMKKLSFKEKFVVQLVVCGLFVLIVMIINMINTDITKKISGEIGAIVSENRTLESLTDGLKKAYQSILGFSDNINTILGNESGGAAELSTENSDGITENYINDLTATGTNDSTYYGQGEPVFSLLDEPVSPETGLSSFRIDEDILNQINNREDLYNK